MAKEKCRACHGRGTRDGQTTCNTCGGTGNVETQGFPFPYWYKWPTVLKAGAVPGPPPVLTAPAVPVQLQIANEADFEDWFHVASALSPSGNDASAFVQVLLQDQSGPVPFSNLPVALRNFAGGSASLPFPVGGYKFGKQSILLATFSFLQLPNFNQTIATGTGATGVFGTAAAPIVVPGPILPGSLSITAGAVVLTDDGAGNLIESSTGKKVGSLIYESGQIAISPGFSVDPLINVPLVAVYIPGYSAITIELDMPGQLLLTSAGTGSQPQNSQ